MSIRKKLLFSVVAVTAFFIALEGILALVGVRPEAQTDDPYVGFSSQIPLMQASEDASGSPVLKTAPAKLVWFNDQQFSPKKPAHTQRVFCVGGSTTFGRPYSDLTSYSNWLRQLLPIADNSNNKWEIINAGGVSYASYRVAAVMEELAQYEPDLFIVYSAHNEFLERRTYANMFDQPALQLKITSALSSTRTWTAVRRLTKMKPKPATPGELLPAEVDEVLNHSVGPADYHRDPEWRKKVLHHYQTNLKRMVNIARGAGAKIVFIAPASNTKDCSPFKSELPADLADDQRVRFELLVGRGQRAATADQSKALAEYQQALNIDPRNPQLLYEIGKSLASLERYDEAGQRFRQALNEDICPLRAVDEITTMVKSTATAHSVPVVEFDSRLKEKCRQELGHELLGEEYFLDHVHPTREVHQQLAIWIIEELIANSIIQGAVPDKTDIDSVAEQIDQHIDPVTEGIAMRNLAKVLHWAGKFSEAAPRALDALWLLEKDPESLLILADCLKNTGRPKLAISRYKELMEVDPFYMRAILPFGELLYEQQDFALAKGYLELAVGIVEEGSEKQHRAKYFLGATLVNLSQYEAAIPLLSQVHEAYPEETKTMIVLAQAKAAIGALDEAIGLYQDAIDIDPGDSTAHQFLGLAMLKQRKFDFAINHLEVALGLDPENQQIRQHLAIARQLQ